MDLCPISFRGRCFGLADVEKWMNSDNSYNVCEQRNLFVKFTTEYIIVYVTESLSISYIPMFQL